MTREILCAGALASLGLLAAAPALAQENLFSGPYVGISLGASWGDSDARTNVTGGSAAIAIPPQDAQVLNNLNRNEDDDTEFTGGLQAGYNWTSASGELMLGVESDISFLDLGVSNDITARSPIAPVDYQLSQEIKTDWLWTLRPRIGYVSGSWMVFGSLGLAVSDVEYRVSLADSLTPPNFARGSFDETRTGWAGSIGGAYAVSDRLSLTGEWMYLDLGEIDGRISTPNGFVNLESDADIQASLLRFGANYRF